MTSFAVNKSRVIRVTIVTGPRGGTQARTEVSVRSKPPPGHLAHRSIADPHCSPITELNSEADVRWPCNRNEPTDPDIRFHPSASAGSRNQIAEHLERTAKQARTTLNFPSFTVQLTCRI